MGIDDRLRRAMHDDGDELGTPAEPDVLRRRARRTVRRRRMSLVSGVLAVALTTGVVVAQQRTDSTPHGVTQRPGLVQAPAGAQLLVSSVGRAVPDPTNVKALATANTQFAFDLYRQLAAESPGKNLVFSPESISNALAMVYAGARGNTAAEIGKALHFDAVPAGGLDAAFNALLQELLGPRAAPDKGRKPLELATGNSAWGQRGFAFEQAYLDTLARYYGTGLRLSDFERDAEHERLRINAYVTQQTDHRITNLLPPGIIDNLTRLVLVNTITFTADWRMPFLKRNTHTVPFTRIDGSHVNVAMMEQDESQAFDGYKGDQFVAARLPYEGGASMLVIVPDTGAFSTVEQKLDPAVVRQITSGLTPGADVWLPKFSFQAHLDLRTTLGALGVRDAFDQQRADFSGMSPSGLYVRDIVHEAAIKIDEQGTKAAAATAAIIDTQSGRMESVAVHADRPFIYLIRDDATGAILFQGRVLDPNQS